MEYSQETLDQYIDYRCHKLGWDESQRVLASQMLLPHNFKEMGNIADAVIKTYEGSEAELAKFSMGPDDFMVEMQLKAALEENAEALEKVEVEVAQKAKSAIDEFRRRAGPIDPIMLRAFIQSKVDEGVIGHDGLHDTLCVAKATTDSIMYGFVRGIKTKTIQKICDYFDISPEHIIDWYREETQRNSQKKNKLSIQEMRDKQAYFIKTKRIECFLTSRDLMKKTKWDRSKFFDIASGNRILDTIADHEKLFKIFGVTQEVYDRFDPAWDAINIDVPAFCIFFRVTRQKMNASQEEMANRLDFELGFIDQIENGNISEILMPTLKKFCVATNTTPRQISDFGKRSCKRRSHKPSP